MYYNLFFKIKVKNVLNFPINTAHIFSCETNLLLVFLIPFKIKTNESCSCLCLNKDDIKQSTYLDLWHVL